MQFQLAEQAPTLRARNPSNTHPGCITPVRAGDGALRLWVTVSVRGSTADVPSVRSIVRVVRLEVSRQRKCIGISRCLSDKPSNPDFGDMESVG